MMPLLSMAENCHIIPYLKGENKLFVFNFYDFNLVPIDSALHSGLQSPIYFSNIRIWYLEQQPNSKNWIKIFLKCPSSHIAAKLEKALTNFFCIKFTRNLVDNTGYVKFWFWPLNVWPRPVSYQNSPNGAKSIALFTRGETIGLRFWHICISQRLKLFLKTFIFFNFNHLHSGGSWNSKLNQKSKIWVHSIFKEIDFGEKSPRRFFRWFWDFLKTEKKFLPVFYSKVLY